MTNKMNTKSKLILEAAINHRNICQVNLNIARNELVHAQDDLDQARKARAFLVKQGDIKEVMEMNKIKEKTLAQIGDWLVNGHTGLSSKAMAASALGYVSDGHELDVPHDAGDFGRCMALVITAPEVLKLSQKHIMKNSTEWTRIMENWSVLCRAHTEQASHDFYITISDIKSGTEKRVCSCK